MHVSVYYLHVLGVIKRDNMKFSLPNIAFKNK